MLSAATKITLGCRRSVARPVARACSGVLSPVKATGGGGALACASPLTAPRSGLFRASNAPCGPHDFASAADGIVESFRQLDGVTAAAALQFGDSSDVLARMKPAGLLGSHVSVRRMSSASGGANGTPEEAAGAAAAVVLAPTPDGNTKADVPRPPFPKIILVKVGDKGRYMDWAIITWDQLKDLRLGGLLEALASSKVFGPDLKDVKISGCIVELLILPASADAPSAADEALAKLKELKELKGAKTVGAMWSTIATADATQLCIRVRLPADEAAAPSAIFNPHADIKDVMAEVKPLAKQAIDAAAAHRAAVSKLEILKKLRVGMTAAEARDAGVKVLREDEKGVMTVGAFTVPRLPSSIVLPLKTFDEFDQGDATLLLLPQRIERAMELVDAVVAGRPLAAHLSGPNGVGKSAVLLLAYLILVARGLPAVLISRTSAWVDALQKDATGGDRFLLEWLWRQNADLIVTSPALRAVFADVLTDQPSPFGASLMPKLHRAVLEVLREGKDSSKLRGIAVLLDEVQNITKAVVHSELKPFPNDAVAHAGQYFANTWHTWNNDNYAFQRLSAASAHSLRDSNLPDGEQHRLRIMEPLADADRDALLASPHSPAFVRSEAARKHVVYAAGNVLRALVTAARQLPADGRVAKAHLIGIWDELLGRMVTHSQRWLESLPSDKQREDAADNVMSLLKGEQRWGSALALYDTGIVYRSADPSTSVVRPVSTMANAAILHVTSAFQSGHRKHLSTISDPSVRGVEFEKQVLASFDLFKGLLPCKLLNGGGTDAVYVSSSYSLPFDKLEEVVPRDHAVLYRPFDRNYACDGIIMYTDETGKLHIFIIECSVTDPCDDDRAKKVVGWFDEGKLVDMLRDMYGDAVITILLCYSGKLMERGAKLPTAAAALSQLADLTIPKAGATAAKAPVLIRVVDLHTQQHTLHVLV